eukprot:51851-Rhodomonas_salina.2
MQLAGAGGGGRPVALAVGRHRARQALLSRKAPRCRTGGVRPGGACAFPARARASRSSGHTKTRAPNASAISHVWFVLPHCAREACSSVSVSRMPSSTNTLVSSTGGCIGGGVRRALVHNTPVAPTPCWTWPALYVAGVALNRPAPCSALTVCNGDCPSTCVASVWTVVRRAIARAVAPRQAGAAAPAGGEGLEVAAAAARDDAVEAKLPLRTCRTSCGARPDVAGGAHTLAGVAAPWLGGGVSVARGWSCCPPCTPPTGSTLHTIQTIAIVPRFTDAFAGILSTQQPARVRVRGAFILDVGKTPTTCRTGAAVGVARHGTRH